MEGLQTLHCLHFFVAVLLSKNLYLHNHLHQQVGITQMFRIMIVSMMFEIYIENNP